MTLYTDKVHSRNRFVREFSNNAHHEDYSWHRDKNDRTVTVLSGAGWELQLDNELPVSLVPGLEYYIAKEIWHRVIPGQGSLKLQITERLENARS